jgi:hypothetical protein
MTLALGYLVFSGAGGGSCLKQDTVMATCDEP